MKKLFTTLFVLGSLFSSDFVEAKDRVRFTVSYNQGRLENKSASEDGDDPHGESYDGGVFNRVSLGCYNSKKGDLMGVETKGFQYDLVLAFGGTSFTKKSEAEIIKRSISGAWPAMSYRFKVDDDLSLRTGLGAIPIIQITHEKAGENHHANYSGLEFILGFTFEKLKFPFDIGLNISYGYLKKISQSDNVVEGVYRLPEEQSFFSFGVGITEDIF